MKRSLIIALCVAVDASPVVAQMAMHEHAAKPSAATLRTLVDKGDLVFELGPVRLPANAMHDDIMQPSPLTVPAGADGWLHGYTVELLDSTGKAVPQTVIHHVNVIVPQK